MFHAIAMLTMSLVSAHGRYVIVYPKPLAESAESWRVHREPEWDVKMLAVDPSDGISPESLRTLIREQVRGAEGDSAILLLGDVGAEGIPTFYFPQNDPTLRRRVDDTYATDDPYQQLDDDSLPDVALGRVPVGSNEEAASVLAKIKRYESDASQGSWRWRINYLASEGRFGLYDVLIDRMFRVMVNTVVPDACDLGMTYASPTSVYCPPPSKLPEMSLRRLAEPAILFNYVGHGYDRGFDRMHWRDQRIPLIVADDLSKLTEPGADLPIAVLACCSCGWYDLADGRPSLSEAMLLAPGGPIAVIAGSRITHPYASAILEKDVTELLLEKQTPTIGALDLQASRSMLQVDSKDRAIDTMMSPIAKVARWPSSLHDLRAMHVRLYNLIGDPGTRIALGPATDGITLRLEGKDLVGEVPGMTSGSAVLIVETARDGQVDELHPPPNTEDLEATAAVNFPRANQRVLSRIDVRIVDGMFRMALPEFGREARLIRVEAAGIDNEKKPLQALGSIRIPVEFAQNRPEWNSEPQMDVKP